METVREVSDLPPSPKLQNDEQGSAETAVPHIYQVQVQVIISTADVGVLHVAQRNTPFRRELERRICCIQKTGCGWLHVNKEHMFRERVCVFAFCILYPHDDDENSTHIISAKRRITTTRHGLFMFCIILAFHYCQESILTESKTKTLLIQRPWPKIVVYFRFHLVLRLRNRYYPTFVFLAKKKSFSFIPSAYFDIGEKSPPFLVDCAIQYNAFAMKVQWFFRTALSTKPNKYTHANNRAARRF